MRKIFLMVATVAGLGVGTASAQVGASGGGMGPQYDGAMNKLFGDNRAFSAQLEIQTSTGDTNVVSMPGKICFDNGKSRFEINIGDVKGSLFTPENAMQFKSLGMDVTYLISRPDLKLTYLVYPDLNSYLQSPAQDASGSANPDDYKLDVTSDGKETLDGHDCAKNKAIVTDKEGKKHEFTVWNATDLKNFPLKVVTTDGGYHSTMLYKNVSFATPDSSLFDPPANYSKYESREALLQAVLTKKFGGGLTPPGQ